MQSSLSEQWSHFFVPIFWIVFLIVEIRYLTRSNKEKEGLFQNKAERMTLSCGGMSMGQLYHIWEDQEMEKGQETKINFRPQGLP